MEEETLVTLELIVTALEKHTKILQALREDVEYLCNNSLKMSQTLQELTERVEDLEANNALTPSDNNLVAKINARLKSIITTLEANE